MQDNADKLKRLREYAKNVEQGNTDVSDFVDPSKSLSQKIMEARNLSEEALADKYLQNTGIRVPGKGSTKSQVEDFLGQIGKEAYPELDSEVGIIKDLNVRGSKADGAYSPKSSRIELDANLVRRSPREAVATLFHEKAHNYDDKVLKIPGSDVMDFEALKQAQKINPNITAEEAYELVGKRHHAKIPKLREGTFGLGALKSYLKNNGVFRAVGPVAAIGGALAAGSASDALADTVIPGGVESVGEGSDQVLNPDQQQSVDASRQLSAGEPMNQARFQALQKMVKR